MALSADQQQEYDALQAELARRSAAAQPGALPTDEASGARYAAQFANRGAAASSPAPASAQAPGLSPEEQQEYDALTLELARRGAPPAGAATAAPQLPGPPALGAQSSPFLKEAPAEPGTPPSFSRGGGPEWLGEMIYPTKTVEEGGVINKKYEDLPDWLRLPELRDLSIHSPLAILGTSAAGAEDTKKILEKQYPGLAPIKQDGKYLLIKSKEDGQTYAWKPGLRLSDLARAGLTIPLAAAGTAAATALTPAALASAVPAGLAGIAAGIGTGLAGSATLEGMKAAAGGNFDKGNVAIGGIVGGAIPAAGKAAGAAKNALLRFAGVAPAGEDLAQTVVRAVNGGTQAASDVAEQVRPDQGFVDAANRQGLIDQVHPDQASTNPRYRQLMQTGEGAAERHAATDAAVRQRFEETVEAAGGDVDRGLLNSNVKTAVEKEIADKYAAARQLYSEAAVPKNAPAPMNGLLSEIDSIAAARNGRLPPALQKLRAAASPVDGAPRTWDEVDALVKELGNPQGAFKKLEPGLAKKLRPIADLDRQAVAEAYGVGDKFRAAQEAFKDALAYEDKAVAAYGEKATNALQRIDQGVKSLAGGNAEPFEQVIAGTPDSMKAKVADSSVLSLFAEDSKINPVKWFDKLKKNETAYNALMSNLSPSVREGLQDSITIFRGVQQAAASKGVSASAAFAQPSGLASKLLILLKRASTEGLGAAAGAVVGGAWGAAAGASIGGAFAEAMTGASAPIREAVRDFVVSPAGRIALEAAANGTAIPQGKLAAMAASAPVRALMKAIGVPASDSFRWLSRAIATSATNAATQPGLTQEAQ